MHMNQVPDFASLPSGVSLTGGGLTTAKHPATSEILPLCFNADSHSFCCSALWSI